MMVLTILDKIFETEGKDRNPRKLWSEFQQCGGEYQLE